ncbi:platelet glycoprotein 4 isoform X2 [Dunckerocampus dactyliophorus]|uniref:platelet glycoprotein 4 isoform X2 n=1 Tax=Dunckerocampus dactyliophorus TaxID=161453 RepID=UPI002404B188|nr:platelet glycoprotein 4 isoform X2 [Dunckerocampus dactyliophorus]
MESCCNARCGLIAGAVIGAVVAVLGGILIPVGDIIIEETVKKESVIEPGTPAYENWVSTGASVYRQIWFFDVQNPQEVVERGVSPVLVEKGPYTYTVGYLPKANITFNANHTVSFLMPLGAIFVPRMSVGSENDTITSLNLAVAGAYTLVPKLLHTILETMIRSSNSSLFQRRTVKELLWGYQDPMLKEVVGLFSPYNGTYDGYYNIHSGKDDVSKVGIIDMWKGSKSLSFWNDAYCDMINGTTASSFPPFVDRTKPLYFFSADICRSVAALYEQTMDLKGIPVYRFGLPSSTFASPAVNPANHCYCKDVKTTKNCTIAGVLDMSSCQDDDRIHPQVFQENPSEYDVRTIQGHHGAEESQGLHHLPRRLDERVGGVGRRNGGLAQEGAGGQHPDAGHHPEDDAGLRRGRLRRLPYRVLRGPEETQQDADRLSQSKSCCGTFSY